MHRINHLDYLNEYPWGLGLGDAGPASDRFTDTAHGFIPENWFLQVGLESGYFGLALFITVFLLLGLYLSKAKHEYGFPLALGLLGICFHSMFLHTWESAAVALSFWGLCAVILTSEKSRSFWEKLADAVDSFRK